MGIFLYRAGQVSRGWLLEQTLLSRRNTLAVAQHIEKDDSRKPETHQIREKT